MNDIMNASPFIIPLSYFIVHTLHKVHRMFAHKRTTPLSSIRRVMHVILCINIQRQFPKARKAIRRTGVPGYRPYLVHSRECHPQLARLGISQLLR